MMLVAGLHAGFALSSARAADEPTPADRARDARRAELEAISRDIVLTAERQAELRSEIAALDKDHVTINENLIAAGEKVQSLEDEVAGAEERLAALAANAASIHASLMERRDVLAEVLSALQRMGRRPPPAMLVRPEDALASVRSAILLGAVVPDLRGAASKLAADLRELVSLKTRRSGSATACAATLIALAENRARLEYLLDEKRNRREASASALAEEERRASALAEQATSLKDLIARMEKEIASAARAKAEADKAARKSASRATADLARQRRPAHASGRLCRRQGAPPARRPAARSSGTSAKATAWAEERKAPRSPRDPRRRSMPRRTAGWSMPALSAATDNS